MGLHIGSFGCVEAYVNEYLTFITTLNEGQSVLFTLRRGILFINEVYGTNTFCVIVVYNL